MVDPVSGMGQVQNLQQARTNQGEKSDKKEESFASSLKEVDEVNLSHEAINLSEVDEVVQKTRTYLAENTDVALSRGQDVDTLL